MVPSACIAVGTETTEVVVVAELWLLHEQVSQILSIVCDWIVESLIELIDKGGLGRAGI